MTRTGKHHRARCGVCEVLCEQRRHNILIGGRLVPAQTCVECETTYALDDPDPEQAVETAPEPRTPSAAEAAALTEHLYAVWQHTAEYKGPVTRALHGLLDERDAALARCAELQRSLTEACHIKDRLSAQLLACEHKAASLRPPPEEQPCKHCGEERLTRMHLIAAGHSYEAAP